MYGTLRGALAGRKIPFDRDAYTATVEGRITGIGKTIRITAIHVPEKDVKSTGPLPRLCSAPGLSEPALPQSAGKMADAQAEHARLAPPRLDEGALVRL